MQDTQAFLKWADINDKIESLIKERREIYPKAVESFMPYERDAIILVKGKYHNSKRGRVLHYRIYKTEFSWVVRVVVDCIGDGEENLGPTDWNNSSDELLQKVVDQFNKLYPPTNFADFNG